MAVKLGYKNVYRDPYGYPEWQGRGMPVESGTAGLSQPSEEPKAPGPLYGWAMIWTLLGIFAGGMALNLTPCVYPLIPITVSYFGGQAAKGGRGKLVVHGLCYMMGLAVANSVLGVAASLTGGLSIPWPYGAELNSWQHGRVAMMEPLSGIPGND